jgi:hypothetical protein
MKQFLLFAGTADNPAGGMHGFAGDFDSIAEAFLGLVDSQIASEWWHVLDTKTGEVVARQHLKTAKGMIGFQKSDWIVGSGSSLPSVRGADLSELDIGLSVVVPKVEAAGEKSGAEAK